MKNLKNLLAAVTLMAILMIGSSTAKAGLLMSDLADGSGDPCTVNDEDSMTNTGIILVGYTGIILTGYTGIILTGYADPDTNCGILITD